MATSSSDIATTSVVVTNTSGKIDTSFMPTTVEVTNLTISGTTTMSATSTTYIGSFPAYQIGKNIQIITTTGTSTFNVPEGVDKLRVELVGAGANGSAGGSGTPGDSGAGGASGAYALKMVDVTGTSTIQVYVTTNTDTTAGNRRTEFGTNGYYFYASTAGSDSANGDFNLPTRNGGRGINSSTESYLYAGKGGDGYFGAGGNGGTGGSGGGANNGANGSGYGSGGGGSTDGGTVGTGSQGVIVITW